MIGGIEAFLTFFLLGLLVTQGLLPTQDDGVRILLALVFAWILLWIPTGIQLTRRVWRKR